MVWPHHSPRCSLGCKPHWPLHCCCFFLFVLMTPCNLFIIFILFIWLHWVLVATLQIFTVARRLLSSCGSRAYLPCSMWDLGSPNRDQTHIPYIGRWILKHWATREVPPPLLDYARGHLTCSCLKCAFLETDMIHHLTWFSFSSWPKCHLFWKTFPHHPVWNSTPYPSSPSFHPALLVKALI